MLMVRCLSSTVIILGKQHISRQKVIWCIFQLYWCSFLDTSLVSLSAEFTPALSLSFRNMSLQFAQHFPPPERSHSSSICTRSQSASMWHTAVMPAVITMATTAALGEISPNSFWPSLTAKPTLKCHWPLEGHMVQAGSRVSPQVRCYRWLMLEWKC